MSELTTLTTTHTIIPEVWNVLDWKKPNERQVSTCHLSNLLMEDNKICSTYMLTPLWEHWCRGQQSAPDPSTSEKLEKLVVDV
jgi:hypothetical protein